MKSKPGVLLYVQTDHLNGETLGAAIEVLYRSGASNVNVISSLTKKNRPGQIILIDCLPTSLGKLESVVSRELQVSGWHRIDTQHCYQNVRCTQRNVTIQYESGSFDFSVEGKIMNDDWINIRPESRCCLALKEELENRGITISLPEIERRLYRALTDVDDAVIDIRKDS